jgi:hypothetical protein
MKSFIIFGALLLILALFSGVYAQQDVNFICKSECISRAGTIGSCNDLCSATDASGKPTKDMDCVSACTGKGGTYYNCYKACGINGGGAVRSGEPPAQGPRRNE